MKKMLLGISAFGLATLLAHAAAVVGQPAPDFTAQDINGHSHTLAGLKGKIVVIEALNLDCPFSANHYKSGAMPELQEWAAAKGVVWLSVNSVHAKHPSYRTPDAAKKEFNKFKMKAAAWIDDNSGALGKAYGLKTTPHIVVIDQHGSVAYNGAIDDQPSDSADPRKAHTNYVRAAIDSLLAGQPVKTKSTKPYGCSVKYGD